jgi:FkbM family methyltransferase
MIDAGAFIGDLTCFWATEYPNARIFALEPNNENFELARRNCLPFGERVTLMRAGLWSECCQLDVTGSEWGARAVGSASGEVAAVDVPFLLEKFSLKKVDVLKLDIEAAEKEVLSNGCLQWLDRIGCLIVEFHGHEIEADVTARLIGAGFSNRRFRSLVFFTNNAIMQP